MLEVKDPYHRREIEKAIEAGMELSELRERVRERLIDPRAGRNEQQAEKGGTCLIDEMAKPNVDLDGQGGLRGDDFSARQRRDD